MAAILKEIEDQALSLTPRERGELIHRLIVSLEGEAEDSPEAIAKAWDEEIARRVTDMLVFRIQGASVRVIAIAHQSRRPGYWVDRR